MSRRQFDLIATERRTVDLTIALLLLAYVRWMRTRYSVRDLTRSAHTRKAVR